MSCIRLAASGVNHPHPQTTTMNRHKTRCQWCPRLYASAGAYSYHLANVHPEKNIRSLQDPQSRKRQLSDVGKPEASTERLDISMLTTFLAPNYYSESEPVSEGSDREARKFSDDEESDGETQQTDATNLISFRHAGQPLRLYFLPEQDAGFDMYAPFRHLIDY